MNDFILAAAQLLANPNTGDNSGTLVKILIIAGVLCVLAVAAMIILPKLSKKDDDSGESEIEEIDDEE